MPWILGENCEFYQFKNQSELLIKMLENKQKHQDCFHLICLNEFSIENDDDSNFLEIILGMKEEFKQKGEINIYVALNIT
jgi:hypothetical protein